MSQVDIFGPFICRPDHEIEKIIAGEKCNICKNSLGDKSYIYYFSGNDIPNTKKLKRVHVTCFDEKFNVSLDNLGKMMYSKS